MKLGGELDASGTATDNGKVEELLSAGIGRRGESGGFEAGQDTAADSSSIAHVFEEEADNVSELEVKE